MEDLLRHGMAGLQNAMIDTVRSSGDDPERSTHQTFSVDAATLNFNLTFGLRTLLARSALYLYRTRSRTEN
jgi:hypothetical protein